MPLHVGKVSSTVNIIHQLKAGNEANMTNKAFSPSTPSQEYTKESAQRCLTLLRNIYEEYNDENDECIQQHQKSLPVCLLHSAVLFKPEFAMDILMELDDKELRFVLTALVNYDEVSNKYEYEDTLTAEDQQELGDIEKCMIQKDKDNTGLDYQGIQRYELFLALVMCGGNKELVNYVLQNGVHITQRDRAGNTVIHLLVDLSRHQSQKAVTMFNHLMETINDTNLKKGLVKQVNNKGVSPLELASEQCLPEMLHALMNTVGVYKFPLQNYATYQHIAYDVTMDEVQKKFNSKSGTTILHLLSMVSEEQLIRLHNFRLFEKEPFKTWVNEKFYANKNVTRAWMVTWGLFAVAYLTSLFWYRQTRDSVAFNITIIVLGCSILLQEIIATYWTLPYYKVVLKRLINGVSPVAFSIGYRTFQVLFIFSAICGHVMALAATDCETNLYTKFVMLFLDAGTIFNGFMGLMFFTQLNRSMGHYLAILEKMLTSTISFIAIGFFYFVGFATTFYIMHIPDYCPAQSMVSDNVTDIVPPISNDTNEVFSSFLSSQYETLLLILSISAPRHWYFETSNNSALTTWIYVYSLVINSLILLNLLIAIMNQRVVEMCERKDSIQKVQQLSIYLFVEEKARLNRSISQMLRLPFCVSRKYKYLYENESKTKMFLHTMEPAEF